MELKDKHIRKLIVKYFDGTISRQESKDLSHALKNDVAVLKQFEKYKNTFLLKSTFSEEADESWKNLHTRIKESSALPSKPKNYLRRIIRVAAIFVISMGLGYLVKISEVFQSKEHAVQYFESSTPRGQKSFILLPDSSKVWLNSESKLSYNSNYNITNRDLELVGEAYFEVTKNKKMVFNVKTEDYITIARGTEFNIMAYKEFGRTTTTLVEGSVEIKTNNGKGNKICTLWSGEKVKFNHSNKRYSKRQTDVIYDIAWRNDQFIFKDIPFKELAQRLGRWYNVNINLEGDELINLKYSGKFKHKESIWQVLDIIKMTTPFQYTIVNRNVNIKSISPMK